MITIKQYNGKWQIEVHEVWEYPTFDLLKANASVLMDMKHDFGQLKKKQEGDIYGKGKLE